MSKNNDKNISTGSVIHDSAEHTDVSSEQENSPEYTSRYNITKYSSEKELLVAIDRMEEEVEFLSTACDIIAADLIKLKLLAYSSDIDLKEFSEQFTTTTILESDYSIYSDTSDESEDESVTTSEEAVINDKETEVSVPKSIISSPDVSISPATQKKRVRFSEEIDHAPVLEIDSPLQQEEDIWSDEDSILPVNEILAGEIGEMQELSISEYFDQEPVISHSHTNQTPQITIDAQPLVTEVTAETKESVTEEEAPRTEQKQQDDRILEILKSSKNRKISIMLQNVEQGRAGTDSELNNLTQNVKVEQDLQQNRMRDILASAKSRKISVMLQNIEKDRAGTESEMKSVEHKVQETPYTEEIKQSSDNKVDEPVSDTPVSPSIADKANATARKRVRYTLASEEEPKADETIQQSVTTPTITEPKKPNFDWIEKGGQMNKFTKSGKGAEHRRFFWVDTTRKALCWTKGTKKSEKNYREVSITGVTKGIDIQKKLSDDKKERCFTVITSGNKKFLLSTDSNDSCTKWISQIQSLL
jgi:hypothetical protein